MRKNKALFMATMFLIVICSVVIINCSESSVSIAHANSFSEMDIDTLCNEIFGDTEIISKCFLYSLNESPDFIYVTFLDSGYAIFYSPTGELLEYSLNGSIDYPQNEEKLFYNGPSNYYIKNGIYFENILTKELLLISEQEKISCSNTLKQKFSEKNSKRNLDLKIKDDIPNNTASNGKSNVPNINQDGYISASLPGSLNTTYISNAQYFLNNPSHGINSSNVCGAVAAQLLLSYNNYYNDRRLIDDKHLNGWDRSSNSVGYKEQNPNYCNDPDKTTRYTLGSNGYYETDEDTYFNYLIKKIPSDASDKQVEQGIIKVINERNTQIESNILYDVKLNTTRLSKPVESEGIKNEINNNRPTIVLMQERLGGLDHYVVAYGYQNLKSPTNGQEYLGYITHFGHSNALPYRLNVWVNSAWCCSYITLHINHTHNYSIYLDTGETRCSECNHRTNALNVEISNNEVEILDAKVYLNCDVIIPKMINNKPVTSINQLAFCHQDSIKSITIPSTVKFIGGCAFLGCKRMRNVIFEEGSELSYIGEYAFEGSGMSEFTLPTRVQNIESGTFAGSSIVDFYFKEGSELKKIGDNAFADCISLSIIEVPSSVTEIGERAFANCKLGLKMFEDTSTLKTIKDYAFYECSNIVNFTIPKSVTSLGVGVFENCPSLFKVVFAEDSLITEINKSTFAGCNVLSVFFTPVSLTHIGENAFANTNIKSINVTKKLAQIDAGAFANCDNLTVYTDYNSAPTTWLQGWSPSNCSIVWGCTMVVDKYPYVVSFEKSNDNPTCLNGSKALNPGKNLIKFEGWFTTSDFSGKNYSEIQAAPNGTLYAKWEDSCVAEGTLITLADGSQKAVEELSGDEMLLVWNMFTGTFDVAPILFIDKDPRTVYEVVNLGFSDGTTVKVISEHAFWDFDLNRYVYLRADAAKYIGHRFNKQSVDASGNMVWSEVKLESVDVASEITAAYSPVTYGHLCYYVNGMLSMPGGTEALNNFLDVDGETMTYDSEKLASDIQTYGLFTYDEFVKLVPVSESVFQAIGGQYLKIAIGKGLVGVDELESLYHRYAAFLQD